MPFNRAVVFEPIISLFKMLTASSATESGYFINATTTMPTIVTPTILLQPFSIPEEVNQVHQGLSAEAIISFIFGVLGLSLTLATFLRSWWQIKRGRISYSKEMVAED
jgi:hypothetical protein